MFLVCSLNLLCINICTRLPDLTICKVIIVIIKSAKQIVHITDALLEMRRKDTVFFQYLQTFMPLFYFLTRFFIVFVSQEVAWYLHCTKKVSHKILWSLPSCRKVSHESLGSLPSCRKGSHESLGSLPSCKKVSYESPGSLPARRFCLLSYAICKMWHFVEKCHDFALIIAQLSSKNSIFAPL